MKYALTLHRSNVYDRQILADLLKNFIHEILRDYFAVQYIVSWTHRFAVKRDTRSRYTPNYYYMLHILTVFWHHFLQDFFDLEKLGSEVPIFRNRSIVI